MVRVFGNGIKFLKGRTSTIYYHHSWCSLLYLKGQTQIFLSIHRRALRAPAVLPAVLTIRGPVLMSVEHKPFKDQTLDKEIDLGTSVMNGSGNYLRRAPPLVNQEKKPLRPVYTMPLAEVLPMSTI